MKKIASVLSVVLLFGCAVPKKEKVMTPQEAFMGGMLVGQHSCNEGKITEVMAKLSELAAELNILKGRIPAAKFGKGKLKEATKNEKQDR